MRVAKYPRNLAQNDGENSGKRVKNGVHININSANVRTYEQNPKEATVTYFVTNGTTTKGKSKYAHARLSATTVTYRNPHLSMKDVPNFI